MIEFPPDRLPPDEDKAARERRVLQTFAAYAARAVGLAVTPGTIVSRGPPEPDILCDVRGYGAVAFELAEILDEGAMKAMSTMMSARNALLAHKSALPIHDQILLQRQLAMREVRVAFRRDRALRELQAAVPRFYRWLLREVADDLHGDAVPIPAELRDAIEYVSIRSPGPPLMDIAFGVTIADATLSAAERKLTRPVYATTAPVELLLYTHDQPLIVNETARPSVFGRIAALVDASIANGHIRRVWVFSVAERYSDGAIKFVYPALGGLVAWCQCE